MIPPDGMCCLQLAAATTLLESQLIKGNIHKEANPYKVRPPSSLPWAQHSCLRTYALVTGLISRACGPCSVCVGHYCHIDELWWHAVCLGYHDKLSHFPLLSHAGSALQSQEGF